MKNWKDYIEAKPEIMYAKPIIKGIRIPVDIILEKMSIGRSIPELLNDYPDLKEEDIRACLAYATSFIRNEIIIPMTS